MPRSDRYWLLVIAALAVLLRLGGALYLGDGLAGEQQTRAGDQQSYHELALRVLGGHGFSFGRRAWPATAADAPTAHWSFLYTLYLAGVYALFGSHPLAARLIQAVVTGILAPWLTYRLGRRSFGSKAGLAAAAVAAAYAYFLYYSATLMTEPFFIVGILWTFDLVGQIGVLPGRRTGRWMLLGLAMGLTVLLRQTFLMAIALVGIWLWWSAPGRRVQTIRGLLLSLLVVALLILPWTVRNYVAFGQFVLLNTNSGYFFFWANHPIHGTNFMRLLPPGTSYESLIPPELLGLDEAAIEKALMQRALQFVLDDPGRFLLLSLSRFEDQFEFWPTANSTLASNLMRLGSFGVCLPFMLYGAYLALCRPQLHGGDRGWAAVGTWLRGEPALWLAFVVLYNGLHLASWSAARYRLPADAVMVVFAGLALTRLIEWGLSRIRHHA